MQVSAVFETCINRHKSTYYTTKNVQNGVVNFAKWCSKWCSKRYKIGVVEKSRKMQILKHIDDIFLETFQVFFGTGEVLFLLLQNGTKFLR